MKTISKEMAARLKACRYLDNNAGDGPNQHRAYCKVCGEILLKGEGMGYMLLMSDAYRGTTVYLCSQCDAIEPDPDAPDKYPRNIYV